MLSEMVMSDGKAASALIAVRVILKRVARDIDVDAAAIGPQPAIPRGRGEEAGLGARDVVARDGDVAGGQRPDEDRAVVPSCRAGRSSRRSS